MTPPENNLLVAAKETVTDIFQNDISPAYYFHNLDHTLGVVRACSEMADYYHLPEEERLPLLLAAWFHDTGYRNGYAANHEEVSIETARAFLVQEKAPEKLSETVVDCIKATRLPQKPANLLQQIICDADLFHLGTDQFEDKTRALRKELNMTSGTHVSKEDWARINVQFLEMHHYFTTYCKERLEHVKHEHLKRIRKKYNIRETPGLPKETPRLKVQEQLKLPAPVQKEDTRKEDLRKEKAIRRERPERGIETMFRTTSSNHMQLSEMADSKAHIMISVNSIIISIIISVLLSKLENNPQFIVPTGILLLTCVAAVTFSILATRPNITSGRFTKEDIQNKKANLLFFGNFHQMGLEEYNWGMNELLTDREYLYSSMIKDIYYLGVVLARKYKYLRISYSIFMYGLIISVLAFVIAFILAPAH
jgi:predicted metal-dependent HD superfamily phosphohydrolase